MSGTDKKEERAMATEKPIPHSEVFTSRKEIVESYDHKPVEGRFERKTSPIYHLRTITNWIKSCLIKGYARPGSRVLDLGCGHGGDLLKYAACNIGYYVGVDISSEQLKEAIRRYNTMASVNFPAKFICADVTEHTVNRPDTLEPGIVFDVVSSQLNMQYLFTGDRQIRTFFRNATDRLEPGGFFIGCIPDSVKILQKLAASPDHRTITIGDICQIKFHKTLEEMQGIDPYGIVYETSLGEVMHNVPEYLLSPPKLERMAEEYGLLPVTQMNFQEFYLTMKNVPPYASLLRTHDAPSNPNTIPAAEWEVLSLYSCFVFQKQLATGVRRSPLVSESDIIHIR